MLALVLPTSDPREVVGSQSTFVPAALPTALALAALWLTLLPGPLSAQTTSGAGASTASGQADSAAPPDSAAPSDSAAPPDESTAPETTFLDSLTVAATLSERPLGETPGQVDVIDAREIEARGYTSITDLVRYTPGVYVDGDPTRLGASGFNIRGIGGNRVLTEIDGIPTAEQFDFGPFSVHRFALDLDTLESVEIVRSAGSALYGSDALGGVVALTTRRPSSYLAGERTYWGLRGGWDGRSDETSTSGTAAVGGESLRASLLYTLRSGRALDNQGEISSRDATRTAPNPIDRQQQNALLQLEWSPDPSSSWYGAVESYDTDADTEILSSVRGPTPTSPSVLEARGEDRQERWRASTSQSLTRSTAAFDSWLWRAYAQRSDTEQDTVERRLGSSGESRREGLLTFEQQTLGLEAELGKALGRRGLLTYGGAWTRDTFDQLRDRTEFFVATGDPVPTSLIYPSKYFPESEVEELGLFAQAELELLGGRLSLVPGVRFDRYELDADQSDPIYLEGNPGTPAPVDLEVDSVSPKLGLVLELTEHFSLSAQYAQGFRAPPMSSVNNGFTNQGGGYRTLPNPDLEPETSDNLELGLRASFGRGSFSVAVFENSYEDFIDTVFLGFNPALFLVEFQPQNVDNVTLEGVEIGAEARLGRGFRARFAYSYTEGQGEGSDGQADEPLASVAPAQWVLGLQYLAGNARWGGELIATGSAGKRASDLPSTSDQFQVPSYEVFDLAAWVALRPGLRLQLSAWNLADATYWSWPYVQGQSQGSPTLDRYTSPGRSFGAQLRYTF